MVTLNIAHGFGGSSCTSKYLDAAAGVEGIEASYERCVASGVTIHKLLAATAWGTKDFYVEDPDGYIIAFGDRPGAG